MVIPEHEPSRINDGSLLSYWTVRTENLPADVGVQWPAAQRISSVVVRYFDGRMVRGPVMARTQQWARLQYWDRNGWRDIRAQTIGQETSSVRYIFEPVVTARLRLLFTEPPDPESRRLPERLGIYVCELEAYGEIPFQVVHAPPRLVRVRDGRGGIFYNCQFPDRRPQPTRNEQCPDDPPLAQDLLSDPVLSDSCEGRCRFFTDQQLQSNAGALPDTHAAAITQLRATQIREGHELSDFALPVARRR